MCLAYEVRSVPQKTTHYEIRKECWPKDREKRVSQLPSISRVFQFSCERKLGSNHMISSPVDIREQFVDWIIVDRTNFLNQYDVVPQNSLENKLYIWTSISSVF